MRLFSAILVTLALSGAILWMWSSNPQVRSLLLQIAAPSKIQTLEIRYSAQGLMEMHKRELLKDAKHTFLKPTLQFHPYLLMEVKYSKTTDRTGEGIILWSLIDGEMVINTNTWEKTHGFSDCLSAHADKHDFKIINALAQYGGAMDRNALSQHLNVDDNVLDVWIDNCRRKSLIVQKGNIYRLHLEEPKMRVLPETKLMQWLVTKSSVKIDRIAKRFNIYQIENLAKNAFGNDFAIRKTTEVFLPVYNIVIQNPDGSQMTSYWNALNGKRLSPIYDLQ
ncbi:MAG: hypothetical protein JW769_02430 [Parachlamydiales bacterium]|nr:hypothetical protein [Parachlamydiales bacterium]